jgi:hypothetical protein
MTAVMSLIAYWNRRVEKFTIFDVKLAQGAAIGLALIIVKLCPQIMSVSIGWFVAFAVICALRPLNVMYLKDHSGP